MNALTAMPFLDFTRPYGFDPLWGNTMHFIFMPPEIKALAVVVAIMAFFAARKMITCTADKHAKNALALACAITAAALVFSMRTDANMLQYYLSANHKYAHLDEDEKMARMGRHHRLFMEAKHRATDGYALVASPKDPLIPQMDAQYIMAPIPPRKIQDATLIIVTDKDSSYNGELGTLTTRSTIITNVARIYAEGEGAAGLYRRRQ